MTSLEKLQQARKTGLDRLIKQGAAKPNFIRTSRDVSVLIDLTLEDLNQLCDALENCREALQSLDVQLRRL